MEFVVSASSIAVNFFPTSVIDEIYQNVQTIVSTPVYSVPLNRPFGADAVMLDLPLPVSQAKLAAKLVQAVEKFEPRVSVVKVTFTGDAEAGKLIPSVTFRIKE